MENQNTDNAVVEEVVHPQTETTEVIESAVESESVETEVAPVADEQSQEENSKFADVRRKAEREAQNKVDEMQAKLDALQSSPSMSFVEKQAKKNNMEVEQYLEAVLKQEQYDEIQAIADADNVPYEIADKLYKATKLEERVTRESNDAKTKAEQDASFDKFISEYKGDINNIPEELNKLWTETGDINEAHRQYNSLMKDTKIAELEAKLGIQNQNLSNSEASTGSVTGNGTPNEKMYTRDEVKNMSREDVNKNYDKVTKSMKTWK